MSGFRKAHTTKHALFKVLASWQKSLDKEGFVGSILMDLSANIFVNDLFFFSAKYQICNFGGDNSLYSWGVNFENIFSNLIYDIESIHEWFVYNFMKANPDKFQFVILGNTDSHALQTNDIPAGNYIFKVNNRNTRTRCEICSKLTIKTPERR